MTQQDFDYRNQHGVVPQLDFLNGGTDHIVAPPVRYTKFASLGNVTKVDGKKLAGGAAGILEGVLHMGGGDFAYGLAKTGVSAVKTAGGVVDRDYLNTNQVISETIKEWESDSWKERYFLADFVPAAGKLGDIVVAQGCSLGPDYNGCGHRIFDNGDYFEGKFYNGNISQGIYIFANGTRYLGYFDEELHFAGFGTLLYADGSCYHGGFVKSQRSGVGACWYLDGAYVGRWANNMRHGDGFLRLENGQFYDGWFENDQLVNVNG